MTHVPEIGTINRLQKSGYNFCLQYSTGFALLPVRGAVKA